MSERDWQTATKLLRQHGIHWMPTSLKLIAYIDKKPYAYKIAYNTGTTIETAVCFVEV